MSAADTSSSQDLSQTESKDPFLNVHYEYEYSDWFSRGMERTDPHHITAKRSFKLSLLDVDSHWNIQKLDGNLQFGVYSVKRRLEFRPFKETTNNWSIMVALTDFIAAGSNDRVYRKKSRTGPLMEYRQLQADNEKPFVEFEYQIEEEEAFPMFTNNRCDHISEMRISVVNCIGLESYLGITIDFTSSFEGSNVILELDNDTRLYYVLELLALNSSIFYEKLLKVSDLPVQDDHRIIRMENTDVRGMVPILKMLMYKKDCLHSSYAETVAFVAKEWQFELILIACEDFFISKLGENFAKYNFIAQEYDMAQLQHLIHERQEEKFEKLKQLERDLVMLPGEPLRPTARVPDDERYIDHITSEKFNLPEVQNKFKWRSRGPLNLAIKDHKSTLRVYKAYVDWKAQWKLHNNGHVYLTVGPRFGVDCLKSHFRPLNWSINAAFTVDFNGKEHKESCIFTPNKQRVTFMVDKEVKDVQSQLFDYSITTEVKCMRGLRYFMHDMTLRYFTRRTPTSDVVLRFKEQKLFANLSILSMFSLFFKGMKNNVAMQTLDDEEQLPMAIMDDIKSSHHLIYILNYCYSINRNKILSGYLEAVVAIADRFLFEGLLRRCEQQLVDATDYPLGLRTLDFAIKYRLYALQNSYLDHFKSIGEIQRLKEDPSYKEISDAAKLLLHEKVMSMPFVD